MASSAGLPLRASSLPAERGAVTFFPGYLRPILILVLVRVVMVVLLYPAMIASGDSLFFVVLAHESEAGRLPMVHFWVEYPPLYPWLVVAIYQVGGLLAPHARPGMFLFLLPMVTSIFETLNLVLIYLIGAHLYDRLQAFKLSLVYALLIPPLMFAMLGMMEPVVEFFLLAGLLALLRRRAATSGALTAVGILFKLYPGVLLPAAWLWLIGRDRQRWLLWAIVPVVLLFSLCYAISPQVFATSVRVAATRPPYETPWVLIEGCCKDGTLPDPAVRGAEMPVLPPTAGRVPWALVTLVTGIVYLAVLFARRRPPDAQGVTALVLFSVALMLVWSKGFSPQYIEWVLPLLLLVFPRRAGPYIALAYVALLFVEYGPHTENKQVFLALYPFVVSARTLLTAFTAALAAHRWLTAGVPDPLPAAGTATLHGTV